jgi:protein-L-isoaspartate(D-aspartate) O-methyltransferase
VERGRATPAIAKLNPALAKRASLAYFTSTRLPGSSAQFELGATVHGPDGAKLADRITAQIRVWDRDRTAIPRVDAVPAGTPVGQLAGGFVITKRHTRLTISWPQTP